jgi:hypothetical protein
MHDYYNPRKFEKGWMGGVENLKSPSLEIFSTLFLLPVVFVL